MGLMSVRTGGCKIPQCRVSDQGLKISGPRSFASDAATAVLMKETMRPLIRVRAGKSGSCQHGSTKRHSPSLAGRAWCSAPSTFSRGVRRVIRRLVPKLRWQLTECGRCVGEELLWQHH